MKIRTLLFAIIFTLLLSLAFSAQTVSSKLPSNFIYKRETGQETGVPIFNLTVNDASVAYDAARGNTFEALGANVQPERDKYGLIFFNAKLRYELHLQKSKGVTITIGAESFDIKTYQIVVKQVIGKLRCEAAVIVINKTIFEELVKADNVVIRVGKVRYNLDQDNIDAFKYFGVEIKKDIERRKPKEQTKTRTFL